MISERNELMVDVSGTGYATPEMWRPFVVPQATILAEIERLADEPRPGNGRRAALVVHPQSTRPGLGFAPGVDVTISVLKPGEKTVPVRRNSNQVEIVIGGAGRVNVDKQAFGVERNDIWNVPAMQTYSYENTGSELFARLSYSNAPLLEKLGAHYFEEDPRPVIIDEDEKLSVTQKRQYARENAPDFEVTPEGARLRGYEFLVDIEVVESKAILWPWKAVQPHLRSSGNLSARQILLLYNPATERRNGTTHSFFATLAGSEPNAKKAPAAGRGHRHTSASINYYFLGNGGSSIVNGVEVDWGVGDLMLSAPAWSEHANYQRSSPVGNTTLTIQDHPLQIGMESLIWQEDVVNGGIYTLGSQAGLKGVYRTAAARLIAAVPVAARRRRSQEQRSAETRERLIVAAIECIERVGYVDATTTLIAEHAEVSRGALQHHFATKADLIVAVIDRVADELNLRFDVAALAAAPLEKRVAAIVDGYWNVFMGASFRAVLGISLSIGGEPALAKRLADCLDEARESYGVVWQKLFRDIGRSNAELEATRRVVMSAARGFGVLKMLQPHGNHDRDRKTLYNIALRELRNGSR